MITKAIIEEIISPYQVKVRIPVLDGMTVSSLSNSTNELNLATICTLPNCYVNLQIGDVVFVGFEDNTLYKAVVLGHLCKESYSNTYADLTLSRLTVQNDAVLPQNTCIGSVTAKELSCLIDARDNLQRQIDNLQQQLDNLKIKEQ